MNPTELQFEDDGPLYAARKKVYPQRVSGTFRRTKWGLMAFCLGVYYLLPFVRWNRGLGAPDQAVLVDLPNSRFYFFFIELWPQEVYYFTGLLIVAAITLFLMNSIGGRIWCGYLCPQTVWTDLFYAVERMIDAEFGQQVGFGLLVDLQHDLFQVRREWLGEAIERGPGDGLDLVGRRGGVEAPRHASGA